MGIASGAMRLINLVVKGERPDDVVDEAKKDYPIDEVDVALVDMAIADEKAGRRQFMSDAAMAKVFPERAKKRKERLG